MCLKDPPEKLFDAECRVVRRMVAAAEPGKGRTIRDEKRHDLSPERVLDRSRANGLHVEKLSGLINQNRPAPRGKKILDSERIGSVDIEIRGVKSGDRRLVWPAGEATPGDLPGLE